MVSIKEYLRSHFVNLRGFKTNRKIVVIESDDWGTIRMQSKEAFQYLKKRGYPVDECGYNKYDSLECNDDIEQLLDVLDSIRTPNGEKPKFTINNIVANPDFNKIKNANYTKYFYESFLDTLNNYPNSEKVFTLYKQGIIHQLLKPQLHGREHVNIFRWLEDLRSKKTYLIDAFENNMFSIHSNDLHLYKMEYMDALCASSQKENSVLKENLIDGINLFKDIWGYKSETFIAPCFIWHSDLNKDLAINGILGIQGYYFQNQPIYGSPKYNKIHHYFGEKLNVGQYYLMRNVTFEPFLNRNKDWVDWSLKEIDIAFSWNKPVIISSHRVNYAGRLDQSNRKNGLLKLRRLLIEIIKNYQDVEFMFSNQLLSLFK
jgi:hypothetical protein